MIIYHFTLGTSIIKKPCQIRHFVKKTPTFRIPDLPIFFLTLMIQIPTKPPFYLAPLKL